MITKEMNHKLVQKLKIFSILISLLIPQILISLPLKDPALASSFQLSGKVTDNSSGGIYQATINVDDPNTNSVIYTTQTDQSGNYSILNINQGAYNIQIIPPTGSSFGSVLAPSYIINSDSTLNFVLVSAGLVTLSGHITNQNGTALPNVHLYLPPDNGNVLVQATTDANGFYSMSMLPGNYGQLDFDGSGNNTLQMPPSFGLRGTNFMNMTQSLIINFTLIAYQVTVTVQNTSQQAISGVGVAVPDALQGSMSFGGFNFNYYSETSSPVPTDASGNAIFWLFNGSYGLNVTPPAGDGYVATNASVTVNGVTQKTVVLTAPVTLSGHITNQNGTALPNVHLYLPPDNGNVLVQATTDANGFYSMSLLPGTYGELDMDGSGNNALQMPASFGLRGKSFFSISQSTTMNITLTSEQVNFVTQNSQPVPVGNVSLQVSSNPQGNLSVNGYNFSYFAEYGSGLATDGSGNATAWLFNGSYSVLATPPSSTGLVAMSVPLNVSGVTSSTITFNSPVTLSGHITNQNGTPLANVHVYLPPDNGNVFVQATTDANGFYSMSLLPGTYGELDMDGSGNNALQMPPSYGLRGLSPITVTQSTTMDFVIPTKQITVHVQDALQHPVSGIAIAIPDAVQSAMTFGGTTAYKSYSETSQSLITDASGNVTLWVIPGTYTFVATPPAGSIYAAFSVGNVSVQNTLTEVISLQFTHPQPTTTISLSPNKNTDGTYPDPVTATLSAVAAQGFSIMNTYYTIDGSSQQTYTGAFSVSGGGTHTITYWSVDNTGVTEATNTSTFTIESNQPPAISSIPDTTINEGDSYMYTGSFTDPDSTSWSGTVDYGDGTGVLPLDISGNAFILNHVYKDNQLNNAPYALSISVTDNQGATSTATTSITVLNVAPTITSLSLDSSLIQLQGKVNLSALFTDPGVLDTHTAQIDWGDGNNTTGTVTESNGSGSVSASHIYTQGGTFIISLTVIDNDGGTDTRQIQLIVNDPPTANANGPYTVPEGGSITLQGSGSDIDGDQLTYAWDLNSDGIYETQGQNVPFSAANLDEGKYTVGLQVCDNKNACTTNQTTVTVTNVLPTIGTFSVSPNPDSLGTTVSVSVPFTDPGVLDTHTAQIDWGDGNTQNVSVTENSGSGVVTGAHVYAAPGIYTLNLTVFDQGQSVSKNYQYVVVYDASAGFITGGGQILSPAGALPGQLNVTGTASFGFSAKYTNNSNIPTGSVSFSFANGNFSFASTALDWLVIENGNTAYMHGTGTINGTGSYSFLLSAVDGSPDTFRINIYDNSGNTIYDNQIGSSETAIPTEAISHGQIMIH